MKTLDKNTFGQTPAAEYLARELNDMIIKGHPVESVVRSVGRRITGTKTQVKDLVKAYQQGAIPAKTVANSLRLMRLEVSNTLQSFGGDSALFFDKLTANVQIGYIKQGIRMCQIARKAERVMDNPHKRGIVVGYTKMTGMLGTKWGFTDSQSGKEYTAGVSLTNFAGGDLNITNVFNLETSDTVTPELLKQRSERRCVRLNKPHTK